VVGFGTAILVTVSPAHIWYSQEARHYSALMFVLLFAVYSYTIIKKNRAHVFWLFSYAGCMLSAVFTHYYAVFFIVPISLSNLWHCYQKREEKRVLFVNLLILGCLVIFLAIKLFFGLLKTESGYLRKFNFFELWMLLFNWLPTGNAIWSVSMYRDDFRILFHYPIMFALHLFLLALLIVGIGSSLRGKRTISPDPRQLLAYMLCLPVFLLGLAFMGFGNNYIERSALVVMPFYYTLLMNGLVLIRYHTIRLVSGTALGILCAATLFYYYGKDEQWTVYKPNPDWRSAAAFLAMELEKTNTQPLILAGTPADVLSYYDKRFHRPVPKQIDKDKIADQEANISRLVRGRIVQGMKQLVEKKTHYIASTWPTFEVRYWEKSPDLLPNIKESNVIYLIHNRYWTFNFKEVQLALSERSGMKVSSVQRYKGIEIFKYEPKSLVSNDYSEK